MRDQVLATVYRHLPGPFRQAGGGNILTKCPFHKGGEERKPSFSINVDRALFHCFTCHVAGDLTYLLRLLGLPRHTIDSELAVLKPLLVQNREQYQLEKANTFKDTDPFRADSVLPEALLGVFDWLPLKLVEQGFEPSLLQDMEIGFDRTNERITYPLRDLYGNLAGFSGGAQHAWQEPKYKVYQGRKKVGGRWAPGDFGKWFDDEFPDFVCENHDFLWNYNRVYPRVLSMSDPGATVYIVEGFKACLWMLQAGYLNTVALMGSYISHRQQLMLHRLNANIVLFLDNDRAGREASIWVGELLWRPMHGRVWVAPYPSEDEGQDTQPDSYTPEGVHHIINHMTPFMKYELEELKKNPTLRQKIEKRRSNGNERVPSKHGA